MSVQIPDPQAGQAKEQPGQVSACAAACLSTRAVAASPSEALAQLLWHSWVLICGMVDVNWDNPAGGTRQPWCLSCWRARALQGALLAEQAGAAVLPWRPGACSALEKVPPAVPVPRAVTLPGALVVPLTGSDLWAVACIYTPGGCEGTSGCVGKEQGLSSPWGCLEELLGCLRWLQGSSLHSQGENEP